MSSQPFYIWISAKELPVRKSCERPIRVSYSSQVTVPMGIGLRRRMVLLPRLDYTDEELYYILLHEFTHFSNGDLYVKMGVSLLCIIVTRYRMYHGRPQYRRWNETQKRWEDSVWLENNPLHRKYHETENRFHKTQRRLQARFLEIKKAKRRLCLQEWQDTGKKKRHCPDTGYQPQDQADSC